MISAILLAAGQSKRLGAENKLLKIYKNKGVDIFIQEIDTHINKINKINK